MLADNVSADIETCAVRVAKSRCRSLVVMYTAKLLRER